MWTHALSGVSKLPHDPQSLSVGERRLGRVCLKLP